MESRLGRIAGAAGRVLGNVALWVVIAVILGALLGNYAFGRFIGRPSLAVVRIDTTLFPWTASGITKMLDHVENQSSIKAVVLEIDCPGGDAVSAEELYLRVVGLRGKKPVVAYVNTVAASGG